MYVWWGYFTEDLLSRLIIVIYLPSYYTAEQVLKSGLLGTKYAVEIVSLLYRFIKLQELCDKIFA